MPTSRASRGQPPSSSQPRAGAGPYATGARSGYLTKRRRPRTYRPPGTLSEPLACAESPLWPTIFGGRGASVGLGGTSKRSRIHRRQLRSLLDTRVESCGPETWDPRCPPVMCLSPSLAPNWVRLGHTVAWHTVNVSDGGGSGVFRLPFIRGRAHLVCFSVRSDSSEPAKEMLRQLSAGEWRPDTDHEPEDAWPDERQATDRTMLLQIIRNFAEQGKPTTRSSVNSLNDGLWEFKRGAKRMTFYDTDGRGTRHTKELINDIADADRDDSMWRYPTFDRQLRLGHCFAKSGPKTDPKDIDEAHEVREEDLEHDRAA